jgi:hypothetical protein
VVIVVACFRQLMLNIARRVVSVTYSMVAVMPLTQSSSSLRLV